MTSGPSREVEAEGVRGRERSTLARIDPADQPEDRADQADEAGLDQHRADHLAAEAPTARRRASSRLRWATRIPNVL